MIYKGHSAYSRKRKVLWLASVLFTAGTGSADVLQIPYTNGKLAQSVVITLNNGENTGAFIAPDSIRVGNLFTVQPFATMNGLTVCNNTGHGLGLMFHVASPGTVRTRVLRDTNWMADSTYPSMVNSMRDLDSMNLYTLGGSSTTARARGYVFAHPGDVQCMTSTFNFDSAFSQVVFIQSGTVYAKVKLVAFTQTLPGPVPPQYQPKTLNTVTLRMVVNTDANNLVDPNPPVFVHGPDGVGKAVGGAASPPEYYDARGKRAPSSRSGRLLRRGVP
jgi:hypothetical protein